MRLIEIILYCRPELNPINDIHEIIHEKTV